MPFHNVYFFLKLKIRCDDKNECTLSLDMDGFENVCECASQKYLELTYLCISSKPESSNLI